MSLFNKSLQWVQSLNPQQIKDAFNKVYKTEPQSLTPHGLCNLYKQIHDDVTIIDFKTKEKIEI